MKTLKVENLKLHIIFWTAFITYEIAVIFSYSGTFSNLPDYFGHYLLNIGTFYFNAHVVLPTAFNEKRRSYLLGIILILTELAVYVGLKYFLYFIFYFFNVHIDNYFVNNQHFITESLYRAIYFIGLSTGYWFALSTVKSRKKIADLENVQLRSELQTQALEKTLLTTENAYLKSQINPHFLLNTLNFLYNSVSEFSEKIADSVMLLSDIMRYALTSADEDGKVKLESEIDQINSYIKLNQARFNEALCIDFEVDGDPDGLRIIPLILITLVENVFKYGDLLNINYPAKIFINLNGESLIFTTQNLKKKSTHNQGFGIGINNIKNRLAMYYVYDLNIEENATEYKSVLKIRL